MCRNIILIDNPIIPIIKSDKNILFEKKDNLSSNLLIINNLFFSNIYPLITLDLGLIRFYIIFVAFNRCLYIKII